MFRLAMISGRLKILPEIFLIIQAKSGLTYWVDKIAEAPYGAVSSLNPTKQDNLSMTTDVLNAFTLIASVPTPVIVWSGRCVGVTHPGLGHQHGSHVRGSMA